MFLLLLFRKLFVVNGLLKYIFLVLKNKDMYVLCFGKCGSINLDILFLFFSFLSIILNLFKVSKCFVCLGDNRNIKVFC